MVNIRFKYRDKINYPNWSEQECVMNSVEECKRIYGLGVDCEYEIISVETEEEAILRRKAESATSMIIHNVGFSFEPGADEKLVDAFKTVLSNAVFKKVYRAFEGGYRVIIEDKSGNEYRYFLGSDGSLTLKP